jgi:flagellar basal-body rod protein FlgB
MSNFIDRLMSQTTMPALEQVVQFTAQRHQVLVNNIANLDTPGYVAQDLSMSDFQDALAKALGDQQAGGGPLMLSGRQVKTDSAGRLTTTPQPVSDLSVTFHDKGTRQVEKEMTALAENTLTYNIAAELLRNQYNTLKMAIRQRS